MAFHKTVAATSGCWHLFARKGDLIVRVYPGMRVGEDAAAGVSLQPEDALVEFGIEHGSLSVRVLAHPGESEAPPIWVDQQTRVRINLPNDTFLIDPEWAKGDSCAETIEIQVRPKPALAVSELPIEPSAVLHFDDTDAVLAKPANWLSNHAPGALVAVGVLGLVLLMILSREVARSTTDVQAAADANVTTIVADDKQVLAASSDDVVLALASPAVDQPLQTKSIAETVSEPDQRGMLRLNEPRSINLETETIAAPVPDIEPPVVGADLRQSGASISGASISGVSIDKAGAIESPSVRAEPEPTELPDAVDQAAIAQLSDPELSDPESIAEETTPALTLTAGLVEGDVGADRLQNNEAAEIVGSAELLANAFGPATNLPLEQRIRSLEDELAGTDEIQTPIASLSGLGELGEVELDFAPVAADRPVAPVNEENNGLPALYPYAKLKVVRQRPPIYPRRDAKGADGFVDVKFTVTAAGRVDDLEVQGDPPDHFSRSAVNALRRWRFEAIVVDGKPISVRTILRLSFRG